jgi:hypothetical protein
MSRNLAIKGMEMTSYGTLTKQIASSLSKQPELLSSSPYFYAVFDDFLGSTATQITNENNKPLETPHRYDNPLEKKNTSNIWNDFGPATYSFFSAMASHEAAQLISQISGINGIFMDPGLHGGGIHQSTAGGKLNLHLDYARHPKLRFERLLNAIYFCSETWDESWGGALQLWDGEEQPEKELTRIFPKNDRLILFEVGNRSWHGFPKEITCPDDSLRTTLALYYCGVPRSEDIDREKAKFVPNDDQIQDLEVQKLIELRSQSASAKSTYVSSELLS